MAAASLSDIATASRDADLIDRLTSAAAQAGIPNPAAWVELHARELAAAPVTEAGDTIASVHAYALATYAPTPRPGQNPAAVTDEHLRAAVARVNA